MLMGVRTDCNIPLTLVNPMKTMTAPQFDFVRIALGF